MNKSNLCYCILTVQYVERYCVAGYLLVIILLVVVVVVVIVVVVAVVVLGINFCWI